MPELADAGAAMRRLCVEHAFHHVAVAAPRSVVSRRKQQESASVVRKKMSVRVCVCVCVCVCVREEGISQCVKEEGERQ